MDPILLKAELKFVSIVPGVQSVGRYLCGSGNTVDCVGKLKYFCSAAN